MNVHIMPNYVNISWQRKPVKDRGFIANKTGFYWRGIVYLQQDNEVRTFLKNILSLESGVNK
jgi:hypothetical protein